MSRGQGERRTTGAFELALAMLFTSGIQHYAEIPEGLAKMPAYVKDFLKLVPAVWEDTRFIDGYPGKFAVLARRGEKQWFVAGINGEAVTKTLALDLSALAPAGRGMLITDGEGASFQQVAFVWNAGAKPSVTLKPNGGFVLVVDPTK